MTTPRPDPRVGTDLGPYRIEALVGRGGMGVVYRATDQRLGRPVALKLLAPGLADDDTFRKRFVHESQMAAAIDDPNIIPVYEAGEIDGVFYLAMRFVDGIDLESRLRAGALEPRETIHLLAQVASALDAAHARGLVHRDVKPGNVLIAAGSTLDRPDHVYLTDFGLTKFRGTESGMTGGFLGTLAYIAPEQIEGRDVDGRADQYSLACLAFECLAGAPPFVRPNDVAVINAHLHDSPPSVHAAVPALPASADAPISRAMSKRPSDRYATCGAFIDALREGLGVRPTAAHAMPAPRRRARAPIAVGAIVLGLVLVAGAMLVASGGLGQPPIAGGSPSGSVAAQASSGGPTVDPNAFPNEAEAALRAKIPVDLRSSCVRGPQAAIQGSGGTETIPSASIRCTSGSFAFDASQLEPEGVTADEALHQAVAGRDVPAGDCEATTPAIGPWSQGASVVGSVACYLDGTDAVVAWTYDDERLLARVRKQYGDVKGMVQWWIDTRDQIGSAQAGVAAPFPSTAESALLRRLPEDLRQDCGRGSYGPISNSLPIRPIASIYCPLPIGSGATGLAVRQISDIEGVTASQVVAAVTGRLGDCPPPAASDGRWSIRGHDVGSIVCYSDQHPTAVIDWSYDDELIVARVRRQDERPDLLFDWWLANATTISQ